MRGWRNEIAETFDPPSRETAHHAPRSVLHALRDLPEAAERRQTTQKTPPPRRCGNACRAPA